MPAALPKDVVVIPAYDESRHIAKVVEDAWRFCEGVIIVDDGSDDKTSEVAARHKAIVLRHEVNLGKGSALKTGCDYAVRNGAENLIVMDADGQHDPSQIPDFLKALQAADIVFGYRRFNDRMPVLFRLGNSVLNSLVHTLFGLKLRDTQCGYRAFTKDAYRLIRWEAADYSMESEMIALAGRNRLSYQEIPIATIYQDKYKGTTIVDGVKIIIYMFWWKLFR